MDESSQVVVGETSITAGALGPTDIFFAYYAYIAPWAESGIPTPITHVTLTTHVGGWWESKDVNRLENLALGAEGSFGAVSLNLTAIGAMANLGCGIDYSNVPIIEPESIRVNPVDVNGDGVQDLDRLSIDASFTVEIPLQRPDSPVDHCVPKRYTFHADSDIVLYPPQPTPPPSPATFVPGAQGQCKFKPLFGGTQWYLSGVTLNHCLCDNGTWISQTGKYCKNW